MLVQWCRLSFEIMKSSHARFSKLQVIFYLCRFSHIIFLEDSCIRVLRVPLTTSNLNILFVT